MGLPKGFKHSKATKRKIGLSNKGKLKGNKPWTTGKHLTKEHKAKLSKASKGKKKSEITRKRMSEARRLRPIKGRYRDSKGYIRIYLPKHPFCGSRGWIMEHRLVMEKQIGRYLKRKEKIHHINRIKDDNRLENLKLFKSNAEHIKYENKSKIKLLKENIELRKEITELKERIEKLENEIL